MILRTVCVALFGAALLASVAKPAAAQMQPGMAGGSMMVGRYAAYERPLPRSFFANRYELTPAEYHRLRVSGLTQKEVYFAANVARITGEPVEKVMHMIFRGVPYMDIAHQLGVNPRRLNEVNPEWRTQAWMDASRATAIEGDNLGVIW